MNELQHHGILNMKWGVRRYQNADGTLTEAGKKRYGKDVSENAKRKKDNKIPEKGLQDPNRWVKEDQERTKRIADTGSALVRQLQSIEKQTRPAAPAPTKMDLSKMTEQEMRQRINRALVEKQYNDLFGPKSAPQVSKGRKRVQEIMEIAGNILSVGSSAVGVAMAIRQLL